jgi:predicted TIM-barrel fold metal-dependent hydrolase
VILETIELFGPDRCMLASNFPVDSLVATLDTIYAGFETITASFSAGDRARLFHDTAARLYRIGG